MRSLAGLLGREPLGAQLTFVAPRHSARLHRVRQAASLARSVGSRLPAKAHFVRTRALREEVARRLRDESFDLLLIQGSDLLWLVEELPRLPPALLLAFNLEHELYRSQIERLGARGRWRAVLMRDCDKLERFERAGLRAIEGVLCVSDEDAARLREGKPGLPVLSVPPVFAGPRHEAPERRRPDRDGLDLGLFGNWEWWPNRAGLDWFLREVLPGVPPDVRLHVFGHGSERVATGDARVRRHGFVPRLDDVFGRCDFVIIPVDAGAGVSVKVAEALYHRVPVLARPFALRGLSLEPDPAVVTLERAEDWIRFLRSPAARELARRRVSSAIAERFSADRHASAVHDFVAGAVARGRLDDSRARSGRPGAG
jgi:glycosyltransferase involved in cell wall biosynthesis